jgi:hypothetical protein
MNAVIEAIETPQQAARRLSSAAIARGFQPEALHEYRDVEGQPIYWRIRLKSATGEKWFRPMRFDGSKFVIGEPNAAAGGKSIYGLDRLAGLDPVFIVEGEWAADHLHDKGLVAITSGSASSANAADWTPLKGRRCILWPDNDGPGAAYMSVAAEKLRPLRCVISMIDNTALALPVGGDAVDWLLENPDASAAEVLALPMTEPVAANAGAFPFRSAAELVKEPTPPIWLVRNWFELGAFVLFFGDAGSCKTWLAIAIAMHVAAGLPWFGSPTRQGAVFVIAGEGYRGLRRRIAGIALHYGIDTENLPLFISSTSAAFTERDSIADVIDSIRALAAETQQQPVLVVVDTLSRNFGAADENSTQDMAEFVRMCDWVREEFGSTLLGIHHVGHADKTRARGNTTLRGALDVEYKINKDEAGIIDCTCSKAKDFEAPEPRRYVLKNVPLDWTDEDGNRVNSAALVPTDAAPVVRGKVARGKNQTTAMRVLSEAYERHASNLERGGNDPEQARVSVQEWKDLCEEAGLDRSRFREVREKLSNTGHISIENGFVFVGEGFE